MNFDKNFDKTVQVRGYQRNCHKAGTIRIIGAASWDYVNIYWGWDTSRNEMPGSFHPDDVKALRDALNELYPPSAPAPVRSSYEVQNKTGIGTVVVESRKVERIERTEVATFQRYSDAEAFAQMKTGAAV